MSGKTKKSAQEMLNAILEGSIEDILDDEDIELGDEGDDTGDDADDEDAYVDLDDFDDETLSEVALAIIESEIGAENMQAFLTENAHMLTRDKILTEDAVGKNFIVLSPQARRQRAINILKLRMARDAGDPRYKKLVVARALVKSLLEKIRTDGKYKKAEQIVRKMKFKVVQNPEAAGAMRKMQQTKLQ